MFQDLIQRPMRRTTWQRTVPAETNGQHSWVQRMASLPETERDRTVTELVRTTVANVLGYAPSARIDTNQEFKALGFDSLSAIQLRNRLNAATGLRFSATTIFDYPTPTALLDHLRSQLVPDPTAPSQSVMTDLDKLEATLSASNLSEQEHAKVAARLQVLLRKWNVVRNITKTKLDSDDALQAATDDELFEALDQEIGSSNHSH
jgi:acyl carrier protein